MSGQPSAKTVKAMQLVRKGMVPHQACLKVGIASSTLYRSRLYKEWKKENAHE